MKFFQCDCCKNRVADGKEVGLRLMYSNGTYMTYDLCYDCSDNINRMIKEGTYAP